MSSFLFGVALDRLLFKALNKYLLKNSNSIETDIRSLILPLKLTSVAVLNIYHYTFNPTDWHIKSLPWNPPAIPSTPEIPARISSGQASTAGFKLSVTSWISSLREHFITGEVMREKPTVFFVLLGTWLFWFVFFLSIGL